MVLRLKRLRYEVIKIGSWNHQRITRWWSGCSRPKDREIFHNRRSFLFEVSQLRTFQFNDQPEEHLARYRWLQACWNQGTLLSSSINLQAYHIPILILRFFAYFIVFEPNCLCLRPAEANILEIRVNSTRNRDIVPWITNNWYKMPPSILLQVRSKFGTDKYRAHVTRHVFENCILRFVY